MTDDQEQRTEGLLPYDSWIESAMRQVVARAVEHVGEHGLPGDHHFYLTFRTDFPGVVIPPRLRAQYPQEMTIVLQHQFWDLQMDRVSESISVGLSFGGVPTTLVIPLAAVTGFADPHVRYALRFRAAGTPEAETETEAEAEPAAVDPEAEVEAAAAPVESPQVVSLDAFRRRTPSKE